MGWTPRTTYHYDGNGRLAYSTVESEWDAHNRAVVDVYKDWESDLHACGHSLDEASHTPGARLPDGAPVYKAAFFVCRACEALHSAQLKQSKDDEMVDKTGESIANEARLWQIVRTQ